MDSSPAPVSASHSDRQGTASSSEVSAPTVQSRRAYGGNPRVDPPPRPSNTFSSSQTVTDNAGDPDTFQEDPGLDGTAKIMVQNISGRIIPNHTEETLSSIWFLSNQIDKFKREAANFPEHDPRWNRLKYKIAHITMNYHSLAHGFNKTLSRPKPKEKHIQRLRERLSQRLSKSFKGEEGGWMKRQDLNDFSHLTGSLLPFEVWAHNLIQDEWAVFNVASEKNALPGRKYRWWLSPVVWGVVHVLIRAPMLAAMILLVAAKKLWGLSAEDEVIMHVAFVLLVHLITMLTGQSWESQMLLTMTQASLGAEIFSSGN